MSRLTELRRLVDAGMEDDEVRCVEVRDLRALLAVAEAARNLAAAPRSTMLEEDLSAALAELDRGDR